MRSRCSVLASQSFVVFLLAALTVATSPGSTAFAQPPEPYLLEDLASGPDLSGSSNPEGWIEAGDHTFFVASLRGLGREYFVTRGTTASTVPLADSAPGDSSENPIPLGLVGGRLFWWSPLNEQFAAFGLAGSVWTSDGTPATTRRVLPGGFGMPGPELRPHSFDLEAGLLRLVGCSLDTCYLWESDGTPGGTVPLVELPAGDVEEVEVAGDFVFFTAGGDLWSVDPDGEATLLVRQSDNARIPASDLASVGDTLLFAFQDSEITAGRQLWRSDGTVGGTGPVSGFSNDARFGGWSREVGPRLYFLLEDPTGSGFEIWRSDGTAQGTEPVTGLGNFWSLSPGLDDGDVALLGERVVFLARPSSSSARLSVFASDGTPGSTRDLLECAQDCPFVTSGLAEVNGVVVFVLYSDADPGMELWRTDGTVAGTGRLADLCDDCFEEVGFSTFGDRVGLVAGGRVWLSDGTVAGTRAITGGSVFASFRRDDPVGRAGSCWLFAGSGIAGDEPWCSEGTPASARVLRDLDRSEASSEPKELIALGDRTVFSALDDEGLRQVWSSDGTVGAVRDLTASRFMPIEGRRLVAGGGFVLFQDRGTQDFLWRTDGTASGTFPVGTLEWFGEVAFQGLVYAFSTNGEDAGIWEIDGTPGGLELVVPFPPGTFSAVPVAVTGEAFYYQIGDRDLWRSDGTQAGTWKVGTLPVQGRLHQPAAAAERDGFLYFAVDFFGPQDELWRTDGSPASARKVIDVPALATIGGDGAPSGLHAHGGSLYFVAETFDTATGRPGGTLFRYGPGAPPAPLTRSPARAGGTQFVSLGGTLYFAFDDGLHGREVWRSDGTPAGTRMVADLHAGGTSFPSDLTPAGDRLFFTATSAGHGSELWVIEPSGPSGGARLVGDIVPGVYSSAPRDLTVAGDTLFFTADDGERGREPWALSLAGSGPPGDPPLPAGPFLTDPAVPGFRFKVRISTPSGDRMGEREADCIPETLCVSGALPGRSEVFLRVVGPKPNGKLWPTLVKFSTSRVEVWVEQAATGQVKYYDLAGASPGVDVLPGLFDRTGFDPAGEAVPASLHSGLASAPSVVGLPLTSPALPGFTFRVEVTSQQGQPIPVRVETDCIEETVCLSGAIPGRSELFLRVVGPKPNGKLWPTLVRFSTSTIDVWITQDATGVERHYRLEGASPGSSDLSGLFDRAGFDP